MSKHGSEKMPTRMPKGMPPKGMPKMSGMMSASEMKKMGANMGMKPMPGMKHK